MEYNKRPTGEFDRFNSQLAATEKEVEILDAKADRIGAKKGRRAETAKKKPAAKEPTHVRPRVVITRKKPEEKTSAPAKAKYSTLKKAKSVKVKTIKKLKKAK